MLNAWWWKARGSLKFSMVTPEDSVVLSWLAESPPRRRRCPIRRRPSLVYFSAHGANDLCDSISLVMPACG